MDKNAVLLSYDLLPILEDLLKNGNAQAAAEITVAIIKYDKDGEEPVFDDSMVAFVWRTVIKPKLDEYKRKYDERAKRNRENGANGGRPKKQEVINKPSGLNETQKTQSVIENPKNPVGLEKPKQTSIDKISIDKIREDEIRKEKINKKEKPPKHKYGEYQNVLLSDEELLKLQTEFPLDWQNRIESVSSYCASHGKSYKDYLATIRNWARNERQKITPQTIPKAQGKNDIQAGLALMESFLAGESNAD